MGTLVPPTYCLKRRWCSSPYEGVCGRGWQLATHSRAEFPVSATP